MDLLSRSRINGAVRSLFPLWIAIPVVAAGLCLPSASAQTTIFQDEFSRSSVPNAGQALAGGFPQTGANYGAGINGTIFDPTTAGNPNSGLADYVSSIIGGDGLLYLGSGGDFGSAGVTYGPVSFKAATQQSGGSVTVSFDYYLVSGSADIIIRSFSGSADPGLDIKLNQYGSIFWNSGSGYTVVGSTTNTNTKITATITANFDDQTFTANVGPVSFSGALWAGATEFWGLTFSSPGDPYFYVDSVKVTTGAPTMAHTLSNAGTSSYVIVRPNTPTAAETTAVDQFQSYFYQVANVALPVYSESGAPSGGDRIYIGRSTHVGGLLSSTEWDDLGEDGFIVRTDGDDVVLAGGGDRGTLYAVFDFLEKQLGCRWWTPTEQSIPTTSVVQIPNLNITETPAFSYRSHYTSSLMDSPKFATIMRENGTAQPQGADWGSRHAFNGFVHTFFLLIDPEDHFSSHPDWFTNPNDGDMPYTTSVGGTLPNIGTNQLCLSNAGVVNEVAATAIEWITANPSYGYVSISENDNGHHCQCALCAGTRSAEGSQSGVNLKFVNQVAALIHAVHPNTRVETLAYRESVQLPAITVPGDKVVFRYAPLQADFGHPLNSVWNGPTPPVGASEYQENVLETLPAWEEFTDLPSPLSSELFVWNYVTNFYYTMLPYPNFNLIGNDLRFFYAHRVKGVFEEGDDYTGGVGDFVQLRAWVIAKLLWNPFIDQNTYTNEFLNGYYGAAGPYLKNYLDLVQSSYLATNRKLGANETHFSYMTLATMNQAKSFFDLAEAAVASTDFLERVRRERVAFDLMWLYKYNPLRQEAALNGPAFVGPSSPLTFLDSVSATADDFGVGQYQAGKPEGTGFLEVEVPRLQKKLAANAGAYDVANIPPSILALIPPGTAEKNLIVLLPYDLEIQKPEWASVIGNQNDSPGPANTSSGDALYIQGSVGAWAVQYHLSQYSQEFYNDDEWQMYVVIRIVGLPSTYAWNFLAGIYDTENPGIYVTHERPIYANNNNYNVVKIGVKKKIASTSYLFITPESSGVAGVYIDQVILVRNPL